MFSFFYFIIKIGEIMKLEEYKKIVEEKSYKDDKRKNMLVAFISGGFMGLLSQILFLIIYNYCSFTINEVYMIISLIFIFIASFLTGFHVFDKVVTTFKAGIIVPITGFAHSLTSAAIDYKNEGLINGIGSNIFKLAGSIILYGIVSGVIVALIKGVIL